MRPTISDVRAFSPEPLRTTSSQLIEADRRAEGILDAARRSVEREFDAWKGEAAAAASAELSDTLRTSGRISIAVRNVADCYAGAANTLSQAYRAVSLIVDDATLAHGLTVTDSGEVFPPAPTSPGSLADILQNDHYAEAAATFGIRVSKPSTQWSASTTLPPRHWQRHSANSPSFSALPSPWSTIPSTCRTTPPN